MRLLDRLAIHETENLLISVTARRYQTDVSVVDFPAYGIAVLTSGLRRGCLFLDGRNRKIIFMNIS